MKLPYTSFTPTHRIPRFSSTTGGHRLPERQCATGLASCRRVLYLLLLLTSIAWQAAAQGKIAFSSERDGNPEIYVMNADGSGQTRLTNNPADDSRPSFSPDGSKIAFFSSNNSFSEIYVMNADGTEQTNLTNNEASDSDPSWGIAVGSVSVSALSPLRNAKAVEKDTDVKVTLNQPWASGTGAANSVTVWSQQAGGKKAGTATVSGNSLTFNPSTDFKPGETVFATTTTASGLAQPHVYQFTTQAAPAPATFSGGSEVGVGSGPQDAVAADVDGDGDLDLLVANYSGSTVSVRLNDGTGTFSGGSTVTLGNIPVKVVAADVNGDGNLDMLVGFATGNTVSVRLNDGAGNFGGGSEIVVQSRPESIEAADVDGDGDLDLLVANLNSSTVSVRLNDGTGTFSGGSTVTVGIGPWAMVTADVDGDGDLDFLTANNSNTVSVRLNDGTGTFSGGSEVSVGSQPRSVVAADVDGDGNLDFLTANINSNSVSVRLNNGTGTFGGGSEVEVGANSRRVVAADVDGDGNLDFLTANINSANVSVRLNDGTGTFGGGTNVAVGNQPYSVVAADVDGDGDLDFLTANSSSNNVSVRLNQPAAPVDTEKPVITTNGDKNVPNDAGACTAVVAVSASATDNASVGTPTGVRSDGLALDAPYQVGITTTITWNVTDVNGNEAEPVEQTVTVTNAAPLISSVTASINPIAVNTAINLTVAYTDNNVTSAAINWGDGTAVQSIANPVNGFVTPHTYTAACVYTVKVTLTDACRVASAEYEYQYVVVYDPNGGFVTGAGWITSPAGAYVVNPVATGRAQFGFVSKYQKGATVPTGKTDFEFKTVGLEFTSTSYEWLVIAGAKAQYKGLGTINGSGNYGFLLTALDGQINGGEDKFRIKIWDKVTNATVYDNNIGSSDDALPGTVLGGGAIVIHSGGNKSVRVANQLAMAEPSTQLNTYPNPFRQKMTIEFSLAQDEAYALAVYDLKGALVQQLSVGKAKAQELKQVEWQAANLPVGVYILKLTTTTGVKHLRMVRE